MSGPVSNEILQSIAPVDPNFCPVTPIVSSEPVAPSSNYSEPLPIYNPTVPNPINRGIWGSLSYYAERIQNNPGAAYDAGIAKLSAPVNAAADYFNKTSIPRIAYDGLSAITPDYVKEPVADIAKSIAKEIEGLELAAKEKVQQLAKDHADDIRKVAKALGYEKEAEALIAKVVPPSKKEVKELVIEEPLLIVGEAPKADAEPAMVEVVQKSVRAPKNNSSDFVGPLPQPAEALASHSIVEAPVTPVVIEETLSLQTPPAPQTPEAEIHECVVPILAAASRQAPASEVAHAVVQESPQAPQVNTPAALVFSPAQSTVLASESAAVSADVLPIAFFESIAPVIAVPASQQSVPVAVAAVDPEFALPVIQAQPLEGEILPVAGHNVVLGTRYGFADQVDAAVSRLGGAKALETGVRLMDVAQGPLSEFGHARRVMDAMLAYAVLVGKTEGAPASPMAVYAALLGSTPRFEVATSVNADINTTAADASHVLFAVASQGGKSDSEDRGDHHTTQQIYSGDFQFIDDVPEEIIATAEIPSSLFRPTADVVTIS